MFGRVANRRAFESTLSTAPLLLGSDPRCDQSKREGDRLHVR